MIDLSTSYLGLKLRTPLVPSASPLTQEFDNVRRLEDAGAAALVLHSLFEELQLKGGASQPGAARPALEGYLNHICKVKQAVRIPVIASLGASTAEGWVDHSQQIEQAGPDALELNLYQAPSQLDVSSAEIENSYIAIVEGVKASVKIPVATKLSPYFTGMTNMAKRFATAGADGLVLFNRFYQPDINLETLEIQPSVLLSTAQELRLPLTWIGILYGRVRVSLAASSGVHSAEDVAKLVLAGADVTMVCSALLRNGIGHLSSMEAALNNWMEKHECGSVNEMKGRLSQLRGPDPAAFERAQYINAVKGVQNVVVTGREAWRILSGH